jgi:hypothetical protein
VPAKSAGNTPIRVEGVNDLLRALSKMDKALQNEVRDASQALAGDLASSINSGGSTRLARRVASSVKARRDRIPVVAMGTGKLSSGTPIRDVMFGAEFGGRARATTQQFQPHLGKVGYFFYPVIRARGREVAEDWFDAIADVLDRYWNKPV